MAVTNLAHKRIGSVRRIRKRNGRFEAFDSERIRQAIKKAVVAVEKLDDEKSDRVSHALAKEAIERIEKKFGGISEPPTVEKIQDIVQETIHDDARRGEHSFCTSPLEVWEGYMYYRAGRTFVRQGKLLADRFTPESVHHETVADITEWNRAHECLTVEQLYNIFTDSNPRRLQELIRAADAERRKDVEKAADKILGAGSLEDIMMIIITGPSSSGKTTTTRRLERLLKEKTKGEIKGFKNMEVDNYFKSLSKQPRVEYNVDGRKEIDYNYEVPEAYNIAMINEDLEKLLKGETIVMPQYDFIAGVNLGRSKEFRLEKGEVLLFDCLHGIWPEMTKAVPEKKKKIIYIESMNVCIDNDGKYMRWTDNRLLRRSLRDIRTRDHPVEKTLWHWQWVRQGECFVFPWIYNVDVVLNGGLPYEMPMLKHFLTGKSEIECMKKDGIVKQRIDIREMMPMFERNDDIFDGRERLRRILRLFDQLPTATTEQIAMVPKDSILREFIGGSEFF